MRKDEQYSSRPGQRDQAGDIIVDANGYGIRATGPVGILTLPKG